MRKFKAVTAVAAATALGVLSNLSPAHADGAGAGVSIGHSTIVTHAGFPPDEPLCAFTQPQPKIFLTNVGTIGVPGDNDPVNEDALAVYAGTSMARFNLDEFYFNPVGTYRDDGSPACQPTFIMEPLPNPAIPEEIAVESWSLEGASPVGSVQCSGNDPDGTYIRVTNAYLIEVTGTCDVTTVVDGVELQVLDAPVTFVLSGNQNPCLGDPPFNLPNCDPPLQDTEFEGVYAQS